MEVLRKIIELLLTTDKTNEEITEIVGSTPTYIIALIRQKLSIKKCDWQKIKAMSNIDLKQLLNKTCPYSIKKLFPDIDYVRRPIPRRKMILLEMTKEYRRAYSNYL